MRTRQNLSGVSKRLKTKRLSPTQANSLSTDAPIKRMLRSNLSMRGRLYRLAKRLWLGRILRYLELWVRYLWQRPRSRRATRPEDPPDDGEPVSVALANADMASAKRIAVLSWDPLVLENAWPRAAPPSDDKTDSSQAFSGPLRQMVYLSLHPALFDLSLQSVRKNLRFIDRIVVLTRPDAKRSIEAVVARHFCKYAVLADDEVHRGELPTDHTARNTWLRRQL